MPLSALPPVATSLPDCRALEDTVLASRIGALRQRLPEGVLELLLNP